MPYGDVVFKWVVGISLGHVIIPEIRFTVDFLLTGRACRVDVVQGHVTSYRDVIDKPMCSASSDIMFLVIATSKNVGMKIVAT